MTLRESRCNEIITRYLFLVNKVFYRTLFVDVLAQKDGIRDYGVLAPSA
jgi:hypothetical protein